MFNKESFLKQNKELKEGGFSEVSDGFYICELIGASLNYSKSSNRKQASFYWKIDPADSEYGGKTIGQHIGLADLEGKDSPQGEQILGIVLSQLGIKDFSELEGIAEDEAWNWMNNLLESLITAKVRLQVLHKDGYQNVRIKKLLEISNPNVEKSTDFPLKSESSRTPSPDWLLPLSHYKQGLTVTVHKKDGDYVAKLMTMPDKGTVKILYAVKEYGSETVSTSIVGIYSKPVEEVEEISEIVEPEQEITLEVGMSVKGIYDSKELTGIVHGFSEDGTIVKVRVGNKAYPCDINSIQLVA